MIPLLYVPTTSDRFWAMADRVLEREPLPPVERRADLERGIKPAGLVGENALTIVREENHE